MRENFSFDGVFLFGRDLRVCDGEEARDILKTHIYFRGSPRVFSLAKKIIVANKVKLTEHTF